jgi:hypothetical protein
VVEFRQPRGGGAGIIRDHPDWRRYRHACPYYRERWAVDDEEGVDGNALLYQIICLQNTPPLDSTEQDRCMRSRTLCWRLRACSVRTQREDPEGACSAPKRKAAG